MASRIAPQPSVTQVVTALRKRLHRIPHIACAFSRLGLEWRVMRGNTRSLGHHRAWSLFGRPPERAREQCARHGGISAIAGRGAAGCLCRGGDAASCTGPALSSVSQFNPFYQRQFARQARLGGHQSPTRCEARGRGRAHRRRHRCDHHPSKSRPISCGRTALRVPMTPCGTAGRAVAGAPIRDRAALRRFAIRATLRRR